MTPHLVRADQVRVGDLLATPTNAKPKIVAQIHTRPDEVTFVHGPNTTTTCPAQAKVRVLRAPARVEDHDAPQVVHSTSTAA